MELPDELVSAVVLFLSAYARASSALTVPSPLVSAGSVLVFELVLELVAELEADLLGGGGGGGPPLPTAGP